MLEIIYEDEQIGGWLTNMLIIHNNSYKLLKKKMYASGFLASELATLV